MEQRMQRCVGLFLLLLNRGRVSAFIIKQIINLKFAALSQGACAQLSGVSPNSHRENEYPNSDKTSLGDEGRLSHLQQHI